MNRHHVFQSSIRESICYICEDLVSLKALLLLILQIKLCVLTGLSGRKSAAVALSNFSASISHVGHKQRE